MASFTTKQIRKWLNSFTTKQMRKLLYFIWLVYQGVAVKTIDVVEKPVKKYEDLELHCGCSSIQNVNSLMWIKHTSNNVMIVQNADDVWGPKLISRNEILLLQKVTRDNTSYTCLSQHANGSTVICGYYAVKMYVCEDSRTIEPENVTNLDVGGSASFTCTQYFKCNNFSDLHFVTMTTEIKNHNVHCSVSNYRLKQTCELRIPDLIEEDFGRAVKCVVNDSGQVSIFQAFPFKKKINIVQKAADSSSITLVLMIVIVGVLLLGVVGVIFKCKYRLQSKYLIFNMRHVSYKVKNGKVLVYTFNEEDWKRELPLLGKLLEDYDTATIHDVKPGQNILEGFGEEAEKSVALLIVVDVMSLAQDETYMNRFHNLLTCDAVKGKSGIMPCYTTILYRYVHEYTYAKKKLEKKFYSIDIKDKEDAKIKRDLLKRLPQKSSVSDVHSKNSYSTFVIDNPGAKAPHCYSRMESNASTSPLVK